MAVFCDFENIALGVQDAKYEKFDIGKVLERLLLKGSIVVKKAYCDWERYKAFKAPMHEAAFELIEIPHVRQSGKNSADIRMVVDALDLCYTKSHVETFVIISGDSDFSPLVSKLRENDKMVIGVGVKNSTSDLLIANCDEFIYYDDLVREKKKAESRKAGRGKRRPGARRKKALKHPPGRSTAGTGRRRGAGAPDAKKADEARRQEAIEIIISTVEALVAERGGDEKIWGSMVKQALKRAQARDSTNRITASARSTACSRRRSRRGAFGWSATRSRAAISCAFPRTRNERDGRQHRCKAGRCAVAGARSARPWPPAAATNLTVTVAGRTATYAPAGLLSMPAATTVTIPADVAYKRDMSFRAVPAAPARGRRPGRHAPVLRQRRLRRDDPGAAAAGGEPARSPIWPSSRRMHRGRALKPERQRRPGRSTLCGWTRAPPHHARAWPYQVTRIEEVRPRLKRFPMLAAARVARRPSDPRRLCRVPKAMHALPYAQRRRRFDHRPGPQRALQPDRIPAVRTHCGDSFATRNRCDTGPRRRCRHSTRRRFPTMNWRSCLPTCGTWPIAR